MNCSTYIFGELSEGYSQYPEDGSSNLFKDIKKQCVAPSQLIIHRDESMMYYVYIRKIDGKRYIGIAVAINGYYFTQISSLFSLFEKEIEQFAEYGIIINYSKKGDLTTSLSSLIKEESEVMEVANSLQTEISAIKTVQRIPQVDYAVSIKSKKIFNENDNNSEIVKASYTFGYTIILKQENYDTLRSTSYRNTLKQLNAQNESLTKEVEKLKETNKQILRQKKQFGIVFVFGIGICLLCVTLFATKGKLHSANNTIQEKDSIIIAQDTIISNLNNSVSNLENKLGQARREKADLFDKMQAICAHYPFIVTSCEVSVDRFKFSYYCPEEKELIIVLRVVNAKNLQVVTSTHILTFCEGDGEKFIDFNRLLDTSQYYYVVLMCNGQIMAWKYW